MGSWWAGNHVKTGWKKEVTWPSLPWSCCRWAPSSSEWCQWGRRTPPSAYPPDGTRSPGNSYANSRLDKHKEWRMVVHVYVRVCVCSGGKGSLGTSGIVSGFISCWQRDRMWHSSISLSCPHQTLAEDEACCPALLPSSGLGTSDSSMSVWPGPVDISVTFCGEVV